MRHFQAIFEGGIEAKLQLRCKEDVHGISTACHYFYEYSEYCLAILMAHDELQSRFSATPNPEKLLIGSALDADIQFVPFRLSTNS